jgi:hypothetical protein
MALACMFVQLLPWTRGKYVGLLQPEQPVVANMCFRTQISNPGLMLSTFVRRAVTFPLTFIPLERRNQQIIEANGNYMCAQSLPGNRRFPCQRRRSGTGRGSDLVVSARFVSLVAKESMLSCCVTLYSLTWFSLFADLLLRTDILLIPVRANHSGRSFPLRQSAISYHICLQSTLFGQYQIESRQNNEIHLGLNIESFAKALRSAEAALEASGSARGFVWGDNGAEAEGGTGVIMELAKKNDKAVLVFEIKAYVSTALKDTSLDSPPRAARVKPCLYPSCLLDECWPSIPSQPRCRRFCARSCQSQEPREPCCSMPDVSFVICTSWYGTTHTSCPFVLHHVANMPRTDTRCRRSKAPVSYIGDRILQAKGCNGFIMHMNSVNLLQF